MSLVPLYELDESLRDLVIKMHLDSNHGAKIIDIIDGGFGCVYKLQRAKSELPRHLAAKCPKIVDFDAKEEAVSALKSMLREVKNTYKLFRCPWVNPVTDTYLIFGWPFLISRWRDGTLSDLIANPHAWRIVDRIASLIQIVRALRMAAERGIGAHQDLKPDNIFFSDLRKNFVGINDSPGLHFKILIGDFGLADAFRDLGCNGGTLPYMAPEQFGKGLLESTAGPAMDIFAVGVIAHECFCDGLHPIGEILSNISISKTGDFGKWSEDCTWRNWAEQEKKDLRRLKEKCPAALFQVISAALSADPKKRPSPEEFEVALWESLKPTDAYENIWFQVRKLESMYKQNEWRHFEEKLACMHKFYEGLS